MFNKKFQYSDFFDCEFMDTVLKIYDLKPKKTYPDLQEVLINYKKKLKKSPKFPAFLNIGETFIQKIDINDNNF